MAEVDLHLGEQLVRRGHGVGRGDVVGVSIAHLVAADLIERGFAAARRGGYPTADDWDATVDIYGRDYMTLGAGEIQKRLAVDLMVLQQQLDTTVRRLR